MNRVEWLRDGSALAVTARKKDSGDANAPPRRSLWLIDYPGGTARKISVDLNDYAGSVSLTADAKSLLVVQGQSESKRLGRSDRNTVDSGDRSHLARQEELTDGTESIGHRTGKLFYAAWIGESSTIWKMDADGSRTSN
jgi:hypothetical protein